MVPKICLENLAKISQEWTQKEARWRSLTSLWVWLKQNCIKNCHINHQSRLWLQHPIVPLNRICLLLVIKVWFRRAAGGLHIAAVKHVICSFFVLIWQYGMLHRTLHCYKRACMALQCLYSSVYRAVIYVNPNLINHLRMTQYQLILSIYIDT